MSIETHASLPAATPAPQQLPRDDDDAEVSVAETVAMLLATTVAVLLVSVLAVALGVT